MTQIQDYKHVSDLEGLTIQVHPGPGVIWLPTSTTTWRPLTEAQTIRVRGYQVNLTGTAYLDDFRGVQFALPPAAEITAL